MKKKASMQAAALLLAMSASAWAQSDKFTINSYEVEGNSLLAGDRVQAILAGFTGPQRSLDDINAAAEALRQAYEAAGYPVVKVFPPVQTASDGRILLKVIEGQIESVKIEGNQAYDAGNIRGSLPALQEKSKPNAKRIIAAIAAANENPAKQVAVNFQAAEQVGNIDAVVKVTEDRPQKFTVAYDNMGSKSTGVNRLNLGYQNANLFNRDHMATVQYGTSIDYPEKSQSLTGGYRIPFYTYGLALDVIGAYSESKATTKVAFGSTDFNGSGTMFGLRLNQALPSAGEFRHRLIYGFDYKDFDNTCKGTNAGKCGTVTSQPFSVTYFATLADPDYQLSGGLTYLWNMEGGPNGGKQEYAAARQGASPDWQAWRANLGLAVPLPADLQFRAGLQGQYSNDRLVAGEQFGLGGASSVRGYVERTVSGDSGYSGNLEFYSPDFGKYLKSDLGARALIFHDYGQVYYKEANKTGLGERQIQLASFGVGLRLNVGRDLSVKFDTGFVNQRFTSTQGTGATRQRGDAFGHAAINLQF